MTNQAVKCNGCDAEAQLILKGDTPQEVVCPSCGVSESYADFRRSVGHQTSVYAAGEVEKVLKDLARSHKNFEYKPGNIRPLSHKFRVDFTE